MWRAHQSVFGQADNTPREHKNQQLLIWSAFLVCTNKFESVTNDFFEVGHTHTMCVTSGSACWRPVCHEVLCWSVLKSSPT